MWQFAFPNMKATSVVPHLCAPWSQFVGKTADIELKMLLEKTAGHLSWTLVPASTKNKNKWDVKVFSQTFPF